MADILGSFEQAVLLAIVRLEDGAYGRAILNEVSARLERDVAAGAVQATLERLERKGLVRSTLGSGTPIRDGRARRFYTVAAQGLRALNEARTTHDSIWRGFGRPLKAKL
jgi:DNA-binding PadR family transcriptional regulator